MRVRLFTCGPPHARNQLAVCRCLKKQRADKLRRNDAERGAISMLQEDQTVTFQPMYEGYQPWFAKLFVFYLLVVLVILLFRAVRFIWILLKLRKGGEQSEAVSNELSDRIASTKQLAGLTVLVSILNLSWWTADIFFGVRTAKAPHLAYILPEIGDALNAFTLGIIISVAAFGGSMWARFALNRRRAAFLCNR
jgi:hypothetical protein